MQFTRDGVLTNFEVAALLVHQQRQRDEQERALPLPGARRGQAGSTAWSSQQVATGLSEQVVSHLEKAPCAGQTRENIAAFQQAVKPFKLTRMECLAFVNTPPRSVVEVHLLIEECEERLQPADIKALLKLCSQWLLVEQPPEAEMEYYAGEAPEDGAAQQGDGGNGSSEPS